MGNDPQAVATITSLGQIEALGNPLRIRILRHARQPITVSELAERLDVPKTRLYYHVNLLLEEGMLAQVDERKSGARIEKIYLRTARDFQLGVNLAEVAGDTRKAAEMAAAILFEPARADAEDAVELILSGDEPIAQLGRTVVRLSDQDAAGFRTRMVELLDEVRSADLSDNEAGRTFSYTSAFVPIDADEETP